MSNRSFDGLVHISADYAITLAGQALAGAEKARDKKIQEAKERDEKKYASLGWLGRLSFVGHCSEWDEPIARSIYRERVRKTEALIRSAMAISNNAEDLTTPSLYIALEDFDTLVWLAGRK